MKNKIFVTENDYDRLVDLAAETSQKLKTPAIATRLSEKLSSAKTLPSANIDNRVVTMNSRVQLKEVNSNRQTELTITYPHDANPLETRISVFSEIGVALLGAREGDIVSWMTPRGTGRFEITKVTYQPEAAGQFDL